MTTVLVVDDDHRARRRTVAALRLNGYSVETAKSLREACSSLRRHPIGALVIDPGRPFDRPVTTVSALRAMTDIPIVVVAEPADDEEKIAVLDCGADDYLTKPYSVEELLARLRAALRRAPRVVAEEPPLETPDFTVDLADRRWTASDGTEVHLTPTEWRIVETMLRRPGRLVSHSELLATVWGPAAVTKTEYLRVYLAGIRHKVEPDPSHPRYFVTAPGLGLRFQPQLPRLVDLR